MAVGKCLCSIDSFEHVKEMHAWWDKLMFARGITDIIGFDCIFLLVLNSYLVVCSSYEDM